jgi:SagB-type dehydrogenase family enzyme
MKWPYLFFILIILESFVSEGLTDSKEMKLPLPKKKGNISLEEALNNRQSVRDYTNEALTPEEISQILWAANGKNKWGKLTSPSAGATYPLVIYLAAGNIKSLSPGLYKYNNQEHSLILISPVDLRASLSAAALNQSSVKEAAALIIICADYNRTTSRYGSRGRRYVEIEVGHVGQNIYLKAVSLDLGTVAVGAFDDGAVKKVLGIEEEPLYIMPLGKTKN